MNDFKYHYLFTSLDLETFEMEDFRYNFVNITAFRLIDTSDIFLKETLKEMQQFGRQQNIRVKKNLAFEVRKIHFSFHLTWLYLVVLVRTMWMNNEWTKENETYIRKRVCKFLQHKGLATNFKYVSCYAIFLFNPLVSHFFNVSYYLKHNSQPICEQALVLLMEFFIAFLRVLW